MGVNQMLDGARAIHYTTAAEKRLAEDALGINSGVVIPLGVNQESLRGSAENFRELFPKLANSPYVLLLSRLHHKKNIESLLEVFFAVTKQGEQKGWKLVIAGNGERDYIEKLKRLAFEKCGDNVIFAGWLDGARKAAAIRGAELVALPSFQENFGLSVVEALACGVPVLVSTQVNLSDEIQAAGAGWVVNLEGDSLQRGLTEALRDTRERRARGAAGERLVHSRYTWPAVAKQLKALYGGLTLGRMDRVKNNAGRLMSKNQLRRRALRYGYHDDEASCAHEYLLPSVLIRLGEISQGKSIKVLDLGCGNGYVASRIAGQGHSVTGVDVSSDGIELRVFRFPVFLTSSVQFTTMICSTRLAGSSIALSPWRSSSTYSTPRNFSSSASVCWSGGALIVSTPYHGYLKNLALSLTNGWDRHFGVDWDGGHIKFFSRKTLAQMASNAGFVNIRFFPVGRFPGLWKSMIMVAQKKDKSEIRNCNCLAPSSCSLLLLRVGNCFANRNPQSEMFFLISDH